MPVCLNYAKNYASIIYKCLVAVVSVDIVVPRAHARDGLWQGLRALARTDFLSMHRVFVSYSQPIRFARFEGKSVNSGLPVLDQKDRGLWGRE